MVVTLLRSNISRAPYVLIHVQKLCLLQQEARPKEG